MFSFVSYWRSNKFSYVFNHLHRIHTIFSCETFSKDGMPSSNQVYCSPYLQPCVESLKRCQNHEFLISLKTKPKRTFRRKGRICRIIFWKKLRIVNRSSWKESYKLFYLTEILLFLYLTRTLKDMYYLLTFSNNLRRMNAYQMLISSCMFPSCIYISQP